MSKASFFSRTEVPKRTFLNQVHLKAPQVVALHLQNHPSTDGHGLQPRGVYSSHRQLMVRHICEHNHPLLQLQGLKLKTKRNTPHQRLIQIFDMVGRSNENALELLNLAQEFIHLCDFPRSAVLRRGWRSSHLLRSEIGSRVRSHRIELVWKFSGPCRRDNCSASPSRCGKSFRDPFSVPDSWPAASFRFRIVRDSANLHALLELPLDQIVHGFSK